MHEEITTTDQAWIFFATGRIQCTNCQTIIPAPVYARTLGPDDPRVVETRADIQDWQLHLLAEHGTVIGA